MNYNRSHHKGKLWWSSMKKWVFFLSVMALLVGAGILLSAYCVSLPADSPAPDFYILNTNTMVFHLPSCPSTEKMKDSNKLSSPQPREELIADGYSPCGNCNP